MITSENKTVTWILVLEIVLIGVLLNAIHFRMTLSSVLCVMFLTLAELVAVREARFLKALLAPVQTRGAQLRKRD